MAAIDGKTVLVTGAASGLGKAWAEGFHADGAKVIAVDIQQKGLAPLADQGIVTIQTDVSKEDQVRRAVETAVGKTGRIDVLFNNAGHSLRSTLDEMATGAFEHLLAVHLFGVIYGMRHALPHMRRQNYGRIINTISRAAEVCGAGVSAYSAAKAGIWAASRSISREVERHDILINLLMPSPSNTAFWEQAMPQLQPPEATYPTALKLATFDETGPNGKVFLDGEEYDLFNSENHPHHDDEHH